MNQSLPPSDEHTRPANTSDATVEAVGKVSEALEWVERARGHLYEVHQLLGHADFLFGDAVELLKKAGHSEQAGMLESEVVGRNVLPGRWTFQIVEEFEDTYYTAVKKAEISIRDSLVQGKRHIYESEMKEERRSHGKRGHEARP